MKDSNDVIKEFNEIVNMTASDLEKWLKSGDSRSAGWPKDESGDGESVGHDSGRKIVEILKANPEKKEDKYTEEQVEHMRKVVAYCKRHLAQEEKTNKNKSTEEVKKTKSYASLKNWGHDFLKKDGREDAGDDDENEEEEKEEGGEEEQEQEEEVSEENEEEDQTAGDKRKKAASDQAGANKKRETAKGKAANGSAKNGNSKKEDDKKEDDKEEEEEEEDDEGGEEESSGGKKPKKGPKPGETVSWNWGSGNPEGKVLDVKADEATITTKRGNKVSRKGDEEDPAVVLDTGKSKAIKSNHELNG